jgi:predicted GIY-YIG superfamily endonuclease
MRDTYKYQFKVGNAIVHGGITDDLQRREREHQNSGKWTPHNNKRLYWSNGHIMKVGVAVTRQAGRDWEDDKGYGPNQHK